MAFLYPWVSPFFPSLVAGKVTTLQPYWRDLYAMNRLQSQLKFFRSVNFVRTHNGSAAYRTVESLGYRVGPGFCLDSHGDQGVLFYVTAVRTQTCLVRLLPRI